MGGNTDMVVVVTNLTASLEVNLGVFVDLSYQK